MTDLSIARGTSAPALHWTFAGVDLSEHSLELELRWRGGSLDATNEPGGQIVTSVVMTGEDEDVPITYVTFWFLRPQADVLPLGMLTTYDLYGTDITGRRKIEAGMIRVDGAGGLTAVSSALVDVANDRSVVLASEAAGQAIGARDLVVPLAEAVAVQASDVAVDRAAVADDRDSVAADRAAVAADKAAAETSAGDAAVNASAALTARGAAETAASTAELAAYEGRRTTATEDFWAALRTRLGSQSIRMATLGDSMAAGVGVDSNAAYGQTRAMYQSGADAWLAYSLMYADPAFFPPDENVYEVQRPYYPYGSPLIVPLPHHRLTVSAAPSCSTILRQKVFTLSNNLTIYYMERTAAAAARVRVTVLDNASGTQLAQQVVDSYTPDETFGAYSSPVRGRLAAVTLELASAPRAALVTLDQVDVIERPEGSEVNGTFVWLGTCFGEGVRWRNLAVSSTTLLNNSADNISRGVTTDERLAKAAAYGANVYILSWGTNDSKTGVSTVSAFRADYLLRIAQIRATVPDVLILLETAPRGAAGSIYENNPIYNIAIRQIAQEANVALIDRELMSDLVGSSFYGSAGTDPVHPGTTGYNTIASVKCRLAGITSYEHLAPVPKITATATDLSAGVAVNTAGGEDKTGSWADIVRWSTIRGATIPRPAGARQIRVQAIVNLADTIAINAVPLRLYIISNTGSQVRVDSKVVSAPLVSGTALSVVTLSAVYTFGSSSTTAVDLVVIGQNFRLRASDDGNTQIEYQWIP